MPITGVIERISVTVVILLKIESSAASINLESFLFGIFQVNEIVDGLALE